ncbi:MAG: hypothetical protein ACE5HP_07125 [Gemmatimonadota bacterium]
MSVTSAADRSRLTLRTGICLLACLTAGTGLATAQVPVAGTGRTTDEGRRISAYDFAVSHAMRALMAAGPEQGRVTVYVARKEGLKWHVYFGSFDARRTAFKIAYDVVQKEEGGAEFAVKKYRRDIPADAELTRAATALVTALEAFQPRTVRFRTYVWQHPDGHWVTYFVPTPVRRPLKDALAQPVIDQRVLVSPDAREILETTNYPEPDSAVWIAPPASPTLGDVLGFFLEPQFAPFRLISQNLVCEINWRGEFQNCLIGPPQ